MDNVGLKRGYLEIMDYREDYAKIYEDEKEELLKIYKDRISSIMFRDYMNSHEDEKKRYEELKIELYNKYKNERKQYTLGKDKYIKEIINKAINENSKR